MLCSDFTRHCCCARFRDASTSLGHSSRHILLRLGYQMGNCARNSYDLALGVQLITYEVHPAPCASKRRRTAAYPNQMPAHSPDARWRSLPRSLAFYLRRSFYLAAYVRCWISSHRARDPQRDRAAFRPRQSRTASEPQGNGIEFASESPGIAAGGGRSRTEVSRRHEQAANAAHLRVATEERSVQICVQSQRTDAVSMPSSGQQRH